MTSFAIHFHKVLAVPSAPSPDSVYFIEDANGAVRVAITDHNGGLRDIAAPSPSVTSVVAAGEYVQVDSISVRLSTDQSAPQMQIRNGSGAAVNVAGRATYTQCADGAIIQRGVVLSDVVNYPRNIWPSAGIAAPVAGDRFEFDFARLDTMQMYRATIVVGPTDNNVINLVRVS